MRDIPDPAVLARLATYQSVMERYDCEPNDVHAVVLSSVRLLIGRRGYSQTLRMLQKRGIVWVAEQVYAEFNELQVMLVGLMADDGGPKTESDHKLVEDLAGMMADLHSDEGKAFLHKLLGRLQRRALWWFTTEPPPNAEVH